MYVVFVVIQHTLRVFIMYVQRIVEKYVCVSYQYNANTFQVLQGKVL